MVPRGGRSLVVLIAILVVEATAKGNPLKPQGGVDHNGLHHPDGHHHDEDGNVVHDPGHHGGEGNHHGDHHDDMMTTPPHRPHYIHPYTTDMPGGWDPLKPDKVPEEWHHYGEFYCPLNDDDCGWKPDREKKFCWKAFPHTTANLENAYHDCKARSIKGCPSRLLTVDNVKNVYYSMTYEDIEYCPPNLRMDGKISISGDWYDFMHDYILEFPGKPWTNDTIKPFEPNNKDGSLTVNFGAMSISGFAHDEDEEIGVICQSCVIEIPECPRICERCDEGTTTPEMMSTSNEEPYRCDNIQGDLMISVVGGWDLVHDTVSSTWMVYDENYNECDAGYNMYKFAEYQSIAAYFPLPYPVFDFGMADWSDMGKQFLENFEPYNPEMDMSPYRYVEDVKVIAGGVAEKPNGKKYVTDAVYRKESGDQLIGFGGKRSGEPEDRMPRGTTIDGGIPPEMVDPMKMPRAGFALMQLYVVHQFDVALREFFMAYGGYTDMEGTLTDTIEYRSYQADPKDYVFGNEWTLSQFKLLAPSRTIAATWQESIFINDESINFMSNTPRHVVALVDTDPVEFMVYSYDNVTYREVVAKEDEQIIPPLQLDDGELAGFIISNISGFVHFMAIDNVTTNVYVIRIDEPYESFADLPDLEWTIMRDAIPEGLSFRHLINSNEDFTLNSRMPTSLLAYSEEEQLSVVKFYDPEKNVFNDDYSEKQASPLLPQFLFNGDTQTLDLPFPVKLDLPPMVGAAIGLDLAPVMDGVTAVTFENSIVDQYQQDFIYFPYNYHTEDDRSLGASSAQWRRLSSAAEARASPEQALQRKNMFKSQGKGLKMATAKHSDDLNRKVSEVASKMAAGAHLSAI